MDTDDGIVRLLDVAGGLILAIVGIGLLYLGFTTTSDVDFLGINAYIWFGIAFLLSSTWFLIVEPWLWKHVE